MPYFIANQSIALNNNFTLTDTEANHLRLSYRIKIGEKIKIQDTNLNRFLCEVLEINKKTITLKPKQILNTPPEPKLNLTLCVANISEQALDTILTKSTELGATNLYIFQATHSPHNLKNKIDSKLNRWKKICTESAKQSERVKIPTIKIFNDLNSILTATEYLERRYFLDFGSNTKPTFPSKNVGSLAFIIGPEGGWSEEERFQAKNQSNLEILTLGPRVLKAETTALAILAIFQFNLGDL